MKSLYFAYPINVFNTPLEQRLLSEISNSFPDWKIENPNQSHHQKNYQIWRKEKGNGILYFLEEVLPKLDTGIALPFSDGMFGAGIVGEINFFLERDKLAWEINHKGIITLLPLIPESKILTIEQTRQRIYINGNSAEGIAPYLIIN